MSTKSNIVIEIYGEGATDVGRKPNEQRARRGVIPIFVRRLCGRPKTMRVKCSTTMYLQRVDVKAGGGHRQKAKAFREFAFRNGSDGAVFVIDSDGDFQRRHSQLEDGRKRAEVDLPMAIGVAHPCIESWLLADAKAIRRAMKLDEDPIVPDVPEEISAPCNDRKKNPKEILRRATGTKKKEATTDQKDQIAQEITDLDLLRQRCPKSFAPFAEEVETHIRPLFKGDTQ